MESRLSCTRQVSFILEVKVSYCDDIYSNKMNVKVTHAVDEVTRYMEMDVSIHSFKYYCETRVLVSQRPSSQDGLAHRVRDSSREG